MKAPILFFRLFVAGRLGLCDRRGMPGNAPWHLGRTPQHLDRHVGGRVYAFKALYANFAALFRALGWNELWRLVL